MVMMMMITKAEIQLVLRHLRHVIGAGMLEN